MCRKVYVVSTQLHTYLLNYMFFSVLKKNPGLLNRLIEQTENPKLQTPLVPQGGRFTNGK